ncbi:MAG: hypothetical protein A3G77_01200 [Acidobacteria bacterium RIFCSPLOWO2_12_FULL_68_19]|nr:MAG: hypothetical protein A3G77_01200 [Acidobacteria bacterium RIFCSPLOWO2_12_FULL_68_19]
MADVMAVSGSASSARLCVSGTAANVHGLGWIRANSRVTVRFESDFDPIAGITLLAIDTADGRASYISDDDSGGNLEPEIQFTASFSGNAALHVGGYHGTSGCYRYQLEIVPSVLSTPLVPPPAPKDAAIQPRAIVGQASSAEHCVAGEAVTNIHGIGYIGAGRGVTVTFATDFDAVAGVTTLDLQAASPTGRYLFDDDSGGNLAPELRFTTAQAGTLALFVGGWRGTAGCYRYKVEVQ